jgi:hypothetical protein
MLAVVGLTILWRAKPRLQGTTLAAVGWWMATALVSLAAAEIVIAIFGGAGTSWALALRLVAATGTLSPIMALLGAKRPQDVAWQFVVAALWAILSLPAARWLLFGGTEEIHPAQLGFLAILILAGAVNGMATRFWPSTLLFFAGQLTLVAPFFHATQDWVSGAVAPPLGMALVVAALALAAAGIPAARSARLQLDRVWLDFRDAFGTVWALRVMERMNVSARMYGWPVSLEWNGFAGQESSQSDANMPPAIEDALRTLLRRFVSPEWIDARLAAASENEQRTVSS